MPVGRACLGRLMNVLGEAKDGAAEIKSEDHLPIHREAPKLTELVTKANTDAFGVLSKRVTESLEEVRELSQKAA